MRIRSGPNRADRGDRPGPPPPSAPPASWCETGIAISPDTSAPAGAVVIPAGDDSGKAPSQILGSADLSGSSSAPVCEVTGPVGCVNHRFREVTQLVGTDAAHLFVAGGKPGSGSGDFHRLGRNTGGRGARHLLSGPLSHRSADARHLIQWTNPGHSPSFIDSDVRDALLSFEILSPQLSGSNPEGRTKMERKYR